MPTIKDVAALAGVAPMTVSRVVNGGRYVRAETRAVVQNALRKLKYSPNLAARALAGVQPIRIGMLYHNLSAAFLSEMLVGTLDQAKICHVQLIVEQCEADKHAYEAVKLLLATGVDGIILPPPLCASELIRDAIVKAGALAVTISGATQWEGLSSVRIDDCAAALAMTRHILSLGHVRIGFITGDSRQSSTELRLLGYRLALEQAGVSADDRLIRRGEYTYRSGLKAAEQLLRLSKPPTAIFASNDDMAAATVAVAHRLHMEVPKDLTVCGFDDTELSRSIWPELTTIRQPIAEMSRVAISLLLEQIKARREGKKKGPGSALLEFALLQRKSTGPPPANVR